MNGRWVEGVLDGLAWLGLNGMGKGRGHCEGVEGVEREILGAAKYGALLGSVPTSALYTEHGSLPSASVASSVASGPNSSTSSYKSAIEHSHSPATAKTENGDNENQCSRAL